MRPHHHCRRAARIQPFRLHAGAPIVLVSRISAGG
jgi:hypothetical protein